MQFKKILKEQTREKILEKLHEELKSGSWVFQRPYMFRGTNRDADPIEVKDVSSRKSRDPKDTDATVDKMIHKIYESCYPSLPKRRESIFAAASSSYASEFGDVYVILPNKLARMSWREHDPHDIFMDLERSIEEIEKIWKNNSDEITDFLMDTYGSVANKEQYFLSFLGGKDWRFDGNDLPCPNSMDSFVEDMRKEADLESKFQPSPVIENMFNYVSSAVFNLENYFLNLNEGYPVFNSTPYELMVDGMYLQVEKELFEDYLDWKEDDLHKVKTDV